MNPSGKGPGVWALHKDKLEQCQQIYISLNNGCWYFPAGAGREDTEDKTRKKYLLVKRDN